MIFFDPEYVSFESLGRAMNSASGITFFNKGLMVKAPRNMVSLEPRALNNFSVKI